MKGDDKIFDIELIKVTKTYKGNKSSAVNAVSFGIEKGEIVTLLGPSGCGKTTTLRLIAGFERPDQGEIRLGGKVVSDEHSWISPDKRGIGMVFQDFALFPHINVFDNVGFGYKGKDRKKRIEEVLSLVNLSGFERRYPHELSGGQQQRVALARALAKRPVVILLDEPFSSLDADLRQQMRVEIKHIIKEAGITAVFVSHDQKDALTISDKVIVMKDGVIQQMGSPRDIYQNPVNHFVATFVGQTNVLKGRYCIKSRCFDTSLGMIPYEHDFNGNIYEELSLFVRPESLVLDPNGSIEGKLKSYTYYGDAIDAVVEIPLGNETYVELLVHIHSNDSFNEGDILRFSIKQMTWGRLE